MVKLNSEDLFFSTQTINRSNASKRKTLGEGGGGKVDLIQHKLDPSRLFAMKTISLEDNAETFRINSEIKVHRQMRHPNIIKIYGSEFTKKQVFIFLEYAPKGDLYAMIHDSPNSPLSFKNKIKIFIQILQATEYIHKMGFLHRDLKLENILLTDNLDARLCDFGWAVEKNHPKRRKSICGTVEYMAPEVFQRRPHTLKVDVWALGNCFLLANKSGIILFELFHRNAPYDTRDAQDPERLIKQTPLVFDSALDPRICRLIRKMLEKEPLNRPSCTELLCDRDLRNISRECSLNLLESRMPNLTRNRLDWFFLIMKDRSRFLKLSNFRKILLLF